jgi:hypothetical protein
MLIPIDGLGCRTAGNASGPAVSGLTNLCQMTLGSTTGSGRTTELPIHVALAGRLGLT